MSDQRGRELGQLLGESSFPHDDCRYIYKRFPDETLNLRADLHVYNQRIDSLSYLFWRVREFSVSDIEMFIDWIRLPFFERYGYSKKVQDAVSQDNTPLLFKRIEIYREIRPMLNEKLKLLLKQKLAKEED